MKKLILSQIMNFIFFILCLIFLSGCNMHPEINGFFQQYIKNKENVKLIEDPTGEAPTEKILVFDVGKGDCAIRDCEVGLPYNSGSNLPPGNRERAEYQQKQYYLNRTDGHEKWYGWHVYLPEDFIDVFPTRTAIGNFKETDPSRFDPKDLNKNSVDHGATTFQILIKRDLFYLANSINYSYSRSLMIPEEIRGKWHKFEINSRWSNKIMDFLKFI